MQNKNKLLNIASISYLLEALLIIPFVPLFGGILLAIGMLLLSYSFLAEEELQKKKVAIIIMIIISFLLNVLAAVLLIVEISDITSEKKLSINSPPPSTESKRIDMLLKLGLGMILISGILIATTSWEYINDIVKVLFLAIMGGGFLALSSFSETKLKIESTTKAYYLLGLAFFLLTWIGIGYFAICSDWFSYAGEGKFLVYFITFILLSIILYLIKRKFNEKEYLYLSNMSCYLAAYCLIAHFTQDILTTTLVLSVISLIINIIPHQSLTTIKQVNYPISYLYTALILTQVFDATPTIILITSIVNIINVLLIAIKNKNIVDNIVTLIISYPLIVVSALTVNIDFDKCLLVFIPITLFSLLIKYNKLNQQKSLIITNQNIYNIITIILVICLSTYSPAKQLIVSLIYLAINIFNNLDLHKTEDKVDLYYQPAVIYIVVASIMHFINEELVFVSGLIAFAITSTVYAAIYHFTKKEHIQKYYFIWLITGLIITFLLNFYEQEIIPGITTLLLAIYSYFTRTKEEKKPRILLYIFILAAIINAILSVNYFNWSDVTISLIILAVYFALTILIKERPLKTANYLATTIPLYALVESINLEENLSIIVTNIFALYILFLIVKLIIKDEETKDIVATIGVTICILPILGTTDILVGLYIGILGILLIFLSFFNDNYKKLFYCGIIVTILNIIIQLWEFWTSLPLPLYLLIAGIGIVIFVTYRETKKKNEPKKVETISKQNEELNIMNLQQSLDTPRQEIKKEEVESLEPVEEAEILNQENEETSVPVSASSLKEKETQPPQTSLELAKFCPNCGTQNKGGKFCRNCGKNLIIK